MTDDGDPSLRNVEAVSGYHIEATDGEIGYTEDSLFNDDNWQIGYLMVDTKTGCPDKES